MKSIHVHFVCTGNVYRSRLAEAYLLSKQLPNIKVSSSGLEATVNKHGPISWYAARLAKRHDLIPQLKHSWTQTTSEIFTNTDMVIFMTDRQHEYAKEKFQFNKELFEIWHIEDLNKADFFGTKDDTDLRRIEYSEKTFEQIKQKVDKLAERLTHANR